MENDIAFDFKQLSIAYFNDNPTANRLRKQLIQNNVGINTENQGNLETIFFSDENIDLINKGLIYRVYVNTDKQYKIAPQSKRNLTIAMRYIFIYEAKYLPFNIAKQIRELNCKVIDSILPTIITEITQRVQYINYINEPRQINSLPQNTSK